MARIDDYQQARALAAQELAKHEPAELAVRCGFDLLAGQVFRVSFLTRTYRVAYPSFEFTDDADPAAQVPLQEQVLLLHYFQGAQPRLKNHWVAYREIPGAGFYFGAFVKRAVDPLKKVFGNRVNQFKDAALKLGGLALEVGSAGFQFNVLPFAPLQVIVHEGDEEFAAEANILFDASVGDYLSPEDAAWLASLTVYRLIGLGG
jgi:hypothetical protein